MGFGWFQIWCQSPKTLILKLCINVAPLKAAPNVKVSIHIFRNNIILDCSDTRVVEFRVLKLGAVIHV